MDDRGWMALAAVIYAGAFVYALGMLLRGERHRPGVMLAAVGAGFLIHTTGLYARGMEAGGCPLGNPFEILQFIAWSATLLYLLVGPVFRMGLLGFFTTALVVLISAGSFAVPGWDHEYTAGYFGGNPWIETHAALGAFSYGAFGVLALVSLMYLIQHHGLKHKKAHGVFRVLPSIVQLDRMAGRLLGIGLVVMSASLAIGFFYWWGDPARVDGGKLLMIATLWLGYVVLWWMRRLHRMYTHTGCWFAMVFFAGLLLSLGPVNASRHPDNVAERREREARP